MTVLQYPHGADSDSYYPQLPTMCSMMWPTYTFRHITGSCPWKYVTVVWYNTVQVIGLLKKAL